MDSASVDAWLRSQPSLIGVPPAGESAALPAEPVPLFLDWLEAAARAGVAEPHAATLATVDSEGVPDARTLILKNVDDRGWAVAGERSSRKGQQLGANPVAALNFWWQPIVRAVRVRGRVREASLADSSADFAARSLSSRATSAEHDWVLWRIEATRVEFWQGTPDRRHLRIVYDREPGSAWRISLNDAAADFRETQFRETQLRERTTQ